MVLTEDLTKIMNLLCNTDVIESCTRERANTKRKLYNLKNVRVSAASLKESRMGCKDTVLPDPPMNNHSVKFVNF